MFGTKTYNKPPQKFSHNFTGISYFLLKARVMKIIFTYSKHGFSDFLKNFFCILLLFSPCPADRFDRITKQFPLTGGTIPAHPTCLLATELAEQLSPVPLPGNADSNSYTISAAN